MTAPLFLKLAARNLLRNRRRSAIALAAVAIGTAGLVFLWAYVDGINRQMIDNVTGYLTGHIQIHQRGYHDDPTLDLAFDQTADVPTNRTAVLLSSLTAAHGVVAFSPRIDGEALASGPEKTRGVLVVGVDPARERQITTLSRALKMGSYLDAADPNGIVIGHKIAELLRVALGEDVTLITQAADGSIGAGRYRVRGMYDSGIDMIDGTYVFMTLSAAQTLYALDNSVTTLAIRLSNIEETPNKVGELQRAAGADMEVLSWRRILPELADDVALHEFLTYIVLFVVFIVVTVGVANTILMGVMERVREFGVMMALGTDAVQVARLVMYEAALLGLTGVALGGVLGLSVVGYYGANGMNLAAYGSAMQMMPGLTDIVYPHIGVAKFSLLSASVFATTILASLYPAWKAARLTPVEAIRGIARAVRVSMRRVRKLPLRLPARAVFAHIALRTLSRNPRRAMLTLAALGAGLAGYLFLDALTQGFYLQMRDNATDWLTGHAQIETQGFRDDFDAKLTLANSDELLARVRTNAGVLAAAPRLQAPTMMSSATQTEPVMLYGVDPDAERRVTRLHQAVNEGRYLSSGNVREVLIGRRLAERLGVRVGEKIVAMAPAADGSLGSVALRIAGLFESGNDVLDRNTALTSLAAARELLAVERDVATIAMRFAHSETLDATLAELKPLRTAPNQQVVGWQTLLPQAVQMLDLLRANLYVILAVVFAVVALGVANTMLMSVLERTREFGLQLALGTQPAQVVRTVLYESLLLALLGLALGVAIGAAIVAYYDRVGFDLTAYSAAMKSVPGLTGVIHPKIAVSAIWLPILALLATSLVAALYPAWRAVRLDAIKALRHV